MNSAECKQTTMSNHRPTYPVYIGTDMSRDMTKPTK